MYSTLLDAQKEGREGLNHNDIGECDQYNDGKIPPGQDAPIGNYQTLSYFSYIISVNFINRR